MKILVTGANGYIGSKVVDKLIGMGNEVIAVDFFDEHINNKAHIIKCNIFQENNWYDFFERPDVCIHLAWRDGFVHNSPNHILDLSKHFLFLKQLIDSGIKQIAVMGSMHEIGYYEGEIDENTECNPMTLYGIAKDSLRRTLMNYCTNKQIVFQWLRAYYVYGDDLYGNSIFVKIRKAVANNQHFFPFTSGKNKFDFLSIDELTNQICMCITQKRVSGIINVCSGKPISLGEKVEWYIKHNSLNVKLEYGKFKERPTESPCIYGNPERINYIVAMKQQKIIVTGAEGQLGIACIQELLNRGYTNVLGIDIDDLDLTNEKAVYDFFSKEKPSVIIHNAAWTSVDSAEKEPDLVYDINSNATKYLALISNYLNAKIIYISTDYVFDGNGDNPFETNDLKNGLSVYGKSKSLGEDYVINNNSKHFIVRTSWVFGIGNNFVNTMIKMAKSGKTSLNVVNDQVGSVTYTNDLAFLLCDMIETEKYGIYHATNEGYLSWADFANEIFKLININCKVIPVSTEEYLRINPNQAKRPLNSRLSKKSLDDANFFRLPDWHDSLRRYLKYIGVL